MKTKIEKPKENKSRSIANFVAQKQDNGKQGFSFVDNRTDGVAQKKQQEMIGSHTAHQAIQKSDINSLGDRQSPIQLGKYGFGSSAPRFQETFMTKTGLMGIKLPETKTKKRSTEETAEKAQSGNDLSEKIKITDKNDAKINEVWLCGSATSGEHQEVICVLEGGTYLRFSRNNGSDTAMSTTEARMPLIKKVGANKTVSDAVQAYNSTHKSWPRYEQADCHAFAQDIVFKLTGEYTGGKNALDDDFM